MIQKLYGCKNCWLDFALRDGNTTTVRGSNSRPVHRAVLDLASFIEEPVPVQIALAGSCIARELGFVKSAS